MSFGFNSVDTIDSTKERRYAAKPLSRMSWEHIKVGQRVQSVLTDVYGRISEIEKPYIAISWENGRISKYKIGDMGNVDVLDEGDNE